MTLDRTDIKILGLLQEHGGLSNLELADRVGLKPDPLHPPGKAAGI